MGKIKDPPWGAAGRGPGLVPGRHRAQCRDHGRLGICRAQQPFPASTRLQAWLLLAEGLAAPTAEVARTNVAGLLCPSAEFQWAPSTGGEIRAKFQARLLPPGGCCLGSTSLAPTAHQTLLTGAESSRNVVRPFPSVLITSLSSHVILTSEGISPWGTSLVILRLGLSPNIIITGLLLLLVSKRKLKPWCFYLVSKRVS